MEKLSLVFSAILQLASAPLPWLVRRPLLQLFLGFRLHPTSRIGLSVILAKQTILEEGARIDHFTLVSPLALIHLHAHATIGRGTRIAGGQKSYAYVREPDRVSALIMEEHSSITRDHLIDCTNTVTIGRYAVVAGWRSQLLSHSPDFETAVQTSAPIRIGAHCFLGTSCIVLKGVSLPDYCILAAGSVLRPSESYESYWLLSGVPAKPVKPLSPDTVFFTTGGLS